MIISKSEQPKTSRFIALWVWKWLWILCEWSGNLYVLLFSAPIFLTYLRNFDTSAMRSPELFEPCKVPEMIKETILLKLKHTTLVILAVVSFLLSSATSAPLRTPKKSPSTTTIHTLLSKTTSHALLSKTTVKIASKPPSVRLDRLGYLSHHARDILA